MKIKTLLLIFTAFIFSACGEKPEVSYKKTSFSKLKNWDANDFAKTRTAFTNSCEKILNSRKDITLNRAEFGTSEAWKSVCAKFLETQEKDTKEFFETNFDVYKVKGRNNTMFTGYYEPVLEGRFEQVGEYNVPLHRKPIDLINVDLGAFKQELKGQRIVGRISGNRLLPYADRKAILDGQALGSEDVLLWLKDPVDAFFLHIQGSGKVKLPSGREVTVGYAADNGHEYKSIGKILVEQKELALENVSLFTIKEWLTAHPEKLDALLKENGRYIFFRFTDSGVVGAGQVELTDNHSLAVDTNFIPLGAPVFINTTITAEANAPFSTLAVAQDKGSAIIGPHRVDIFFGNGDVAEKRAGFQRAEGEMFVLFPKS